MTTKNTHRTPPRPAFRARLFLLAMVLTLAGCDFALVQTANNAFSTPRPVAIGVLCDHSQGSTCTPHTLGKALNSSIPIITSRHGTLRLSRVDEVQAAVEVAKYVATPAPREGHAAKVAHERRTQGELKLLLQQASPEVFNVSPRSTPLAAAISLMALNVPVPGHETNLLVITDGQETSVLDLECQSPDPTSFLRALHQQGLLLPDSMRGMNVVFLSMNPLAPIHGARCAPSLKHGLHLRELWKAALTTAGATVEFTSDDEPPDVFTLGTLIAIPLIGGGRAKREWKRKLAAITARAKEHQKAGMYARKNTITEVHGRPPTYDKNDPRQIEVERQTARWQLTIEDLDKKLAAVSDGLTEYLNWRVFITGVMIAVTTEAIGCTLVLRDLGMPAPERYPVGIALAFALIGLAVVVRYPSITQHQQSVATSNGTTAGTPTSQPKKTPVWYLLLLVGIGILCTALTVARISTNTTEDTTPFTELMFGIVMLAATIGPAFITEFLIEQLRPIMPLVRKRKLYREQLKEAKKAYRECLNAGGNAAEVKRGWENAADMFHALYNNTWNAAAIAAGKPPVEDPIPEREQPQAPPPITPSFAGLWPPQTVEKPNGGTTWPSSRS